MNANKKTEIPRVGGKRDIQERTFAFALGIVDLCRSLDGKPDVGKILALQLLRSGTSVGANVEEAQAGQRRADFISKYAIALKEIREARYWLRLMAESKIVDPNSVNPLIQEASELGSILGAIVLRSRQRT